MTQSYVVIDGREALVEVTALADSKSRVTVDGVEYEVDPGPAKASLSNDGGQGASLLIDGRQFEVFSRSLKLSAGTRNYALSVNGKALVAAVTDPLSHLAQESDTGAGSQRWRRTCRGEWSRCWLQKATRLNPDRASWCSKR